MRGNPEEVNRAASEQSRAARDKHREPDGWEADARAEERAEADAPKPFIRLRQPDDERFIRLDVNGDPLREVDAYRAGFELGRQEERRRLTTALDAIQREAAPLMIEGSSFARAMAKVIGEMRRCVEGGAL